MSIFLSSYLHYHWSFMAFHWYWNTGKEINTYKAKISFKKTSTQLLKEEVREFMTMQSFLSSMCWTWLHYFVPFCMKNPQTIKHKLLKNHQISNWLKWRVSMLRFQCCLWLSYVSLMKQYNHMKITKSTEWLIKKKQEYQNLWLNNCNMIKMIHTDQITNQDTF